MNIDLLMLRFRGSCYVTSLWSLENGTLLPDDIALFFYANLAQSVILPYALK